MNRIIKFRAKLLKKEGNRAQGEWVYGLPQQRIEIHGVVNLNKPAEIGYIVSYEPERMLQSGAPDGNLYWYEIEFQTLGEFTGLLDKDGKEIYEGDIVATGLGENYTKSIVRIGHAETEGSDNCYAEEYYGVYLEGSAGLLDELLHQRMYVIGNIYDNPLQG